ncbi:hypothetical protein OA58_20255 [Microcystis aeruginosa NIES-88]|nr:hypothetical protein OA58_20255 [Microcystis aeruginosa NIES-88]
MNYPTVEKDSCYISYPSKIGQRYCLGGWVMGVGSGEVGCGVWGVGCGVWGVGRPLRARCGGKWGE